MLKVSACQLLDQIGQVISECKVDDFSRPMTVLNGSTIGQHIRHTLEFFLCLFDAKSHQVVNYDNREHNRMIATDPELALNLISTIKEYISHIEEDFFVYLEANYALEEGTTQKMPSSLYRELAYNIEHAIHHMALIKIAVMLSLTYIQLPDNFGVASSTVRYQAVSDNA